MRNFLIILIKYPKHVIKQLGYIHLHYTLIDIYLYINCPRLLRMYDTPLPSRLSCLSEVVRLPFPEVVIFIAKLVVRGGSLAFSLGNHFELSSALISLSSRGQKLVTELGPNHVYSIGSELGSL